MKPATESTKEVRKSVSTCSDEEKRNKFEKTKKQYPKIKGNKDVFCWTCHRSGNIATCSRCPRAYHLKCGHLEKIPEPSEKWICPECDIVQRANSQTSSSQLGVLSQMLGYVIERMKLVKGSEDFCEAVDTNKWHDYLDYIIKPMDIPKLTDNVRRHLYKSTEAFLADFRWLVHDSYVYNSVQSAYTKTAKSMSAVAKQECEEIKNCADCYLHAYSIGESAWFIEPCTTPHVLVWAQLSGFPYWPGKVMRHVSGDMIDVRFFGDHSRANVPATSCFLYSRLMPCTVKRSHPKMADGIEEAEEHIKRLKRLYGSFYYAQYRVRYIPRDEDIMRKLQLPGFRKPNETPEFVKKVDLERVDKMILDRDFQSEMKPMVTQKKALVPTKRKSVELQPKEGSKRMLVQLNTPKGPKCAIMNMSGSESDSSPKHVSEQMVENSLLNSSMGSPAPAKRIRLSDKFESPEKETPQKTAEPENDAMTRQVVETSPKELADIYKSISPNKPKTPIKDTGIIESITRKLLSPNSLRSIRSGNVKLNDGSPSVRNIAVEKQKATSSSSVKLKQNGFQIKSVFQVAKGLSTECREDSDWDSDSLVIASRESSPARNTNEMSPRDNSVKTDPSPVISVESRNRLLDNEITTEIVLEEVEKSDSKNLEKVEKSDSKNQTSDGEFTAGKSIANEKISEVRRISDEHFSELGETRAYTCKANSDSSTEKIGKQIENIESNNCALDGNSSVEKVGEKCETGEPNRSIDGDSIARQDESDRVSESVPSTEKAEECSEANQRLNCVVDNPPTENVEKNVSNNSAFAGDSSAKKEEEEVKMTTSTNNLSLVSDTAPEKVVKANSLVIECPENSRTESSPCINMVENEVSFPALDPVEHNGRSVNVSDISNSNDGARSGILDLLNGDLSDLYDNLSSQCSSSENSVINDNAINTTSKLDLSEESRSELSVGLNLCSRSTSSSLQVLDSKSELSSLSLLSSDIQIYHTNNSSTNCESNGDCLPEDPKLQSESVKTTETVIGHNEKCSENLQLVENVSLSSTLATSDVPSSLTDEVVRNIPSDVTVSSKATEGKSCESASESISPKNPSLASGTLKSSELVSSSDRSSTKSSMEGDTGVPTAALPSSDLVEENMALVATSSSLPEKRQPVQESGCGMSGSVPSLDNTEKNVEPLEKSTLLSETKEKKPLETTEQRKCDDSDIAAPLVPCTNVMEKKEGLVVKSTPLSKTLLPEPPKEEPSVSDQLPRSSIESKDVSNVENQKDVQPKVSHSTDILEMSVESVDEISSSKSSEMQKPQTIVFTNSIASDNVFKERSTEEKRIVEKRNEKCSSNVPKARVVKEATKPQALPVKNTDKSKPKEMKTPATNMASVSAVKDSTKEDPSKNFVTITSSMSLSDTSARTHPVISTLKSSSQKDLKRKASEAPSSAVKNQKIKEDSKGVIASGMPRPIIIKVEPEEVHEISDNPPYLTNKTAPIPTKPSIKVVHLSNLMENPPRNDVKRNCATPQNNVPCRTITARLVEKKSSELLDVMKEDITSTDVSSCSKDLLKMIPPFNPKKTFSDVRALIEAKKQFISAKLKADIYEMLDGIKADYESHIELLTNVSDRYLQQFENTFETDKTKLYEDFKNKLRDQMDQQITEIKRKQWCANCGAEASYHCCWNHAYCGDKCQKEDWASHTQVCTQYNMSATDPYIRASPRFQALLEKQNASGAPKKISLQDLIDVPVAVSIQNSPPKLQLKKTKKVLATTPTYVPTISIPDNELPELPKPPPSAKSFLTAPVQRLNNGEQISFGNGKHAYRIIQNPVTHPATQKTVKVVGTTASRNQSVVNSYSGPLMRLGSQSRSFALVVGDDNARKISTPSQSYGTVKKSGVFPQSTSGSLASRLTTKTVTVTKKGPSTVSVVKKSPSIRVMEDNELATILSRNHLRDAYLHASS